MPPHNNKEIRETQESIEIEKISTVVFNSAKNYLIQRLPIQLSKPRIAIICGSGLGGLASRISGGGNSDNNNDYGYDSNDKKTLDSNSIVIPRAEFKYEDIPGFVNSTVPGHEGKLVFGLIGETPVVCMVGRFHFYEGHDLNQVTFPIRVFKSIGVEILIVTNATGSLDNEKFKVGTICVIADHISLPGLTGINPLIGPNLNNFGSRFVPMSDAYDYELREKAFKAADMLKFPKGSLKEAVYCYLCGPTYETRAEAKFLKNIGGDLVGMSTVPEVIVARHCGLRVLGLSLVTNKVAISDVRSADPSVKNVGVYDEFVVNHTEVLEAGKAKSKEMQRLVEKIAELL